MVFKYHLPSSISSFILHLSPFTFHPSSFTLHLSSLNSHPSSYVHFPLCKLLSANITYYYIIDASRGAVEADGDQGVGPCDREVSVEYQ